MSTAKKDIDLKAGLESAETQAGAVCIPNIGTAERRKRLGFGIVSFVVGVVLLVVLMAIGANPWWRLLLLLPFMSAGSGFFQWQDKTCVGLTALQSRKLGDAIEKIEDPAELAQVRRQANRVQLKAGAAALALTVIALVLP